MMRTVKCLMCLHFYSTRPPRTSRLFILLSLGRRSALRRSCAVLRQTTIRQKPVQHLGSTFRAGSLQSLCRLCWCTNVRGASPGRRKLGAGAAAAVLVVCRTGAGRRQPDGSQSDVVMSGVVDSGPGSGHGNIDANDPQQTWLFRTRFCAAAMQSSGSWVPVYTDSTLPCGRRCQRGESVEGRGDQRVW